MYKINLERAKKLRKENGYTIQQMADKLGICKAYYCQLEKGNRRLSYENAILIATEFKSTPDKVFLTEE